MSAFTNGASPIEDQDKLLKEVLNVVGVQSRLMEKSLDDHKLMDGLKHCSNMLAELRTSALTPKTYYQLYMAIFDALRHLTAYLTEAHQSGRHHLADLYELVQYAGNIVPRLYLMITVGSVYMGMPEAPVREIMRDMMEMTRGVQHPIRGLFLRHYLSMMTRDSIPIGESSGPEGNVHESINFILTNFTEMNKLWVRLQHQGHSRDKERRESERRDLKILVGKNLERISQLDGTSLEKYKEDILPGILDQVVSCRDVIAQEYLMEVITHAFPDEFHLRTLEPFLSTTAQLHPKVNVKQIIISLIDRLAAYAQRVRGEESDSEDTDETEEVEGEGAEPDQTLNEETAVKAAVNDEQAKEDETDEVETKAETDQPENTNAEDTSGKESTKEESKGAEETLEASSEQAATQVEASPTEDSKEDKVAEAKTETETEQAVKLDEASKKKSSHVKKVRGIPEDVELFAVFWGQVIELVKARPDLTIQDLTALLVALVNLSLSCYPERLDYVDQILAYAKEKNDEHKDHPDLHSKETMSNLKKLLEAPITSYDSVLTLLKLDHYQSLLNVQQFNTRQNIAKEVVQSMLKNETVIDEPEDVDGILDLCTVLLRDQKDAPVASSSTSGYGGARGRMDFSNTQEELAEEQGSVAKIIHMLRSDDNDKQYLLLSAARKQLSDGGERIRYTFPPLVASAVQLARRYKLQENQEDEIWEKKVTTLFRFIHQVIYTLHRNCESADLCLQLYLLAAQSADECGFEEIAYEFFVGAFTIYEESISESKAQYQAITCIIGMLQQTRAFGADHYDTLVTKATLHSSKLLKKPDQCRGVYLASHLWWRSERDGETLSEDEMKGSSKRVLEGLQKAAKIADSCMDTVTQLELFVEILNQYVYYFEKGNTEVTAKHLTGLIDLINTTLSQMDDQEQGQPTANSSSLVEYTGPASEYVIRHFHSTLRHLESRKRDSPKYNAIDLDAIDF